MHENEKGLIIQEKKPKIFSLVGYSLFLDLRVSNQILKEMKRVILVFCLFAFGLLVGCGDGNEQPEKRFAETSANSGNEDLQKGVIMDGQSCAADQGNRFAVYLPSQHNQSQAWPVMIFFDAHARGAMPLRKYQALADQFGYILVGSNSSKNGLPPQQSMNIFNTLIDEVKGRFSADTARIYTSGFSGGARIATWAAASRGDIPAVVGCGAGFPQLQAPIKKLFRYLGVVGNQDFNYLEFLELKEFLDQSGLHNHVYVFEGKHAWPDLETMRYGFIWTEMDAVRTGVKSSDPELIESYKAMIGKREKDLDALGETARMYDLYKEAISFTTGVVDNAEYSTKLSKLENDPALVRALAARETLRGKEKQHREYYTKKFGKENLDWWQMEITRLRLTADNSQGTPEAEEIERIFSFLSILGYMQSSNAIQQRNMTLARYSLAIYGWADPEIPDQRFLQAKFFALNDEPELALNALREAKDLGYWDYEKVDTDPDLAAIRSLPGFIGIRDSIANTIPQ